MATTRLKRNQYYKCVFFVVAHKTGKQQQISELSTG